jgi:nucleotide-binding universal stress UspA family protein
VVFKNIVVALNDSACAMQAFELALTLAKREETVVTICTVVDPLSAIWSSTDSAAEPALARAYEGAHRIVAEAVARAQRAGLVAEGKVRAGAPAEQIVALAIETRADAIVMGTHGWSGIKNFVMGSVAESVLRSAPCPVVVVRDQAPWQSMPEEA